MIETILGIIIIAGIAATWVHNTKARHAIRVRRELDDAIDMAQAAEYRRRIIRQHLD